jgi:hypothetical protein
MKHGGPETFFGSERVVAPLSSKLSGPWADILRLQSQQELVPFCTPTNLIALKLTTIEGSSLRLSARSKAAPLLNQQQTHISF